MANGSRIEVRGGIIALVVGATQTKMSDTKEFFGSCQPEYIARLRSTVNETSPVRTRTGLEKFKHVGGCQAAAEPSRGSNRISPRTTSGVRMYF